MALTYGTFFQQSRLGRGINMRYMVFVASFLLGGGSAWAAVAVPEVSATGSVAAMTVAAGLVAWFVERRKRN